MYDLIHIFPDNGVMTTPKRRILSFVFTVLCFKKSLLIRIIYPRISLSYTVVVVSWPENKPQTFEATDYLIIDL